MKKQRKKPELIKTKEGWRVTDGWIGTTYVQILKQPSNETIDKLYEFFVEVGKETALKKEKEVI